MHLLPDSGKTGSWAQPQRCRKDPAARTGNDPQPTAARADRHTPGSSRATRKPSPAFQYPHDAPG